MPNKPKQTWKAGGISIVEWANQRGSSYSISKQFKDKATGDWKSTNSFFKADLEKLADLLSQILGKQESNQCEESEEEIDY